jgi:hypothetical protein
MEQNITICVDRGTLARFETCLDRTGPVEVVVQRWRLKWLIFRIEWRGVESYIRTIVQSGKEPGLIPTWMNHGVGFGSPRYEFARWNAPKLATVDVQRMGR